MRAFAKNEFPGSPGERVSLSIDYSGQLAASESITAAGTWTLPTGLTSVATSYTANSVSIIVDVASNILANGPITLESKNETTTDGNNTPEDCVLLRIEDC